MPAALSSKIEYKTLAFKIETVDEDQGMITGYLSTFNNIDLGNGYVRDRVLPGAYKRTINSALERKASKGKKYLWPHLWMHDPNTPIGGYISAKEDAKGLLVTYQLDINKNAAGIPNNSTATMVFSGYKCGYIDEQSIGYEVIQSEMVEEVVDGKKTMVRNLIELRLWEGSSITSNFAMDPEALVTDVKSIASDLELKTVCGNTSGPIGPRDESWDGSKAEGQIWDAAYDDDSGKINTSLAKKYFMVVDGDNQKKGSYSYPFWFVGSDPHICVGAVKAIAGAISGARGASAPDGLKSKVETLYNRINKKYPDDTALTPSWNDGKRSRMNTSTKQLKTLLEHYNEEMAEDLLEDWQDVYVCALTGAIFDAFVIGDQPEADISEALDAFKELVLSKFVAQAMECDLSQYLSDNDYGFNPAERTIHNGSDDGRGYYGYMSRHKPDAKAMTAGDATTGGFTTEHVDKLHNAAAKAMKVMQAHADSLHDAADTVTKLVDGANKEKARALPYGMKAGRTFSSANVQALSDHADNLHDMADAHTKAMTRYTKSVNTVADDLATILQGSEPTFADPNAGTADGNQEGKRTQRTPFNDRTRTTQHTRSSHDDTVTEDEIVAALGKLKALKTV